MATMALVLPYAPAKSIDRREGPLLNEIRNTIKTPLMNNAMELIKKTI